MTLWDYNVCIVAITDKVRWNIMPLRAVYYSKLQNKIIFSGRINAGLNIECNGDVDIHTFCLKTNSTKTDASTIFFFFFLNPNLIIDRDQNVVMTLLCNK